MSNDPVADRLAALESEVAFQNESMRGLNDALANQQQDLLLLQRQVTLLGEQLRNLRDTGVVPQADSEKPPHY